MISSPRNSVAHNQQAKLAVDYNELLKELSSHEMTSVGCYTIGETIGEGSFGKVKKGTHKLTGKVVAIKKINKQHAPLMAREIHHHRQLKHPNIIMLYEMITTESAIHIISEYCPNGDLLDALTESGRCMEIRVHKWFRQLTDALSYCHTRGIVHRDLKLENILLDAEDNVKICDFGFARFTQKNQYLETFCGSLSYSAPEVILRKKYTGPETDIWSLGVILYTLIAGEYPFDDDSEVMTQRKIVQVDYEMPFYFSSDLSSLVTNMLQFNPCDRITFDAIETHPWVVRLDNASDDEDDEEEACLTPSSSTTTHQSASDADSIFSQHENTIAFDDGMTSTDFQLSPDLKFSPQVRSSLGISKQQHKSPRFSAPTLNRRSNNATNQPASPLLQSSFRSSLPSSFYQQSLHHETLNMTPIEQRLFAALTAAGFDRDALIKMQTGECDTSSTLWHLLLENMSQQHQKPISNVSDAFAFAVQARQPLMESTSSLDLDAKKAVDQGTQTLDENEPIQLPEYIQPYPKPAVNVQHKIQTIGFGSHQPEKQSGWFTSVKSWFGSKQQQQQQQQQQRGRSLSNCSTISSPIASPSSYRNFDTPMVDHTTTDSLETNVMSPPIYRTGSQKYRRRVLQLSDPPVCELDQLTYNGTTSTVPQHTNQNTGTTCSYRMKAPSSLGVHVPPTALTSATRLATDTFSILTTESSEPQEVDMCQKRYSLLYNSHRQQKPPVQSNAPPLSPSPEKFTKEKSEPLSDFSSDSSSEEEESNIIIDNKPLTSPHPPQQMNGSRLRSSRFEFTPRSRLSAYGMQEQRGASFGTKAIIEEEEEEEE